MSLRINHNIAALDAQRNLANTGSSISKVMEKLSSGYRINRAADDPAGLVISEQFRAQIAGLNKAISNSEGSVNMIQTAEGALNEISSLLVSMRELAIHAANEGMNDANQLAADQAEIQNAIATIDRIAVNTQFGTKKLLDGTKDNIATITTANSSDLSILKSNLTSGSHSITATKTADSSATINTTSLGVSLNGTGTPVNLEEKIHNIDVLQASAGASKVSNAIAITDAFSTGLKLGAAAAAATITSAAIGTNGTGVIGTSQAGTYSLILNYQENGEAVTGDQTLTVALTAGMTEANALLAINNAITANTALSGKITATVSGAHLLTFSTGVGSQYSVKFTSYSTTSGVNGSANDALKLTAAVGAKRGTSVNTLNFAVTAAKATYAARNATIAAATYTSMATLATAVQNALKTANAFGTVTGGAVANVDVQVYDTNKLRFFTYDEGSDYKLQHNSTGVASEQAMTVLGMTADTLANSGTDALVSFDSYTTAITSVKYAASSNVTLYNKAAGTAGRGSVNLTVGTAVNGINLGNLLLDVKAAKYDVRLDAGPATSVTAGKDAVVYNSDRSQSVKLRYGLTSQGGSESITDTDQSLVFQIGANVGQTAAIGLRNMASSSLGKSIAGNMFSSLSKINVETVQGAQDTQAVIDAAIDEVSTSRGTLGSFQKNTLESNMRNLRVASQNLTASESSIRDTDMAESMSEFVKNQILMQAGVAMLSQGNQLPQVVLSLFK
jgi:flagellin